MIIGKHIIADVFTLDFFQNDIPAISCDALTDSGIEIKADVKEVKGGQGNNLIATIHSSRNVTVTANDPTFDFGILATNLGSSVVVGEGIAYCPRETYTAKTDSDKIKVTLKKTPLNPDKIIVYGSDGTKLTKTTDYTISAGVIEFVGNKIKDNDVVYVEAYAYTTSATAERISIGANTYASGGKLVLTTIEINSDEMPVAKIQFVFPNAKPSGDVKIDTKAERDAVQNNLQFNVLKGSGTDELGYVIREPFGV